MWPGQESFTAVKHAHNVWLAPTPNLKKEKNNTDKLDDNELGNNNDKNNDKNLEHTKTNSADVAGPCEEINFYGACGKLK